MSINDYELDSTEPPLYQDIFSVVKLAYVNKTKQPVAVKIIPKKHGENFFQLSLMKLRNGKNLIIQML
jgi:hypothetical protein